MLWGNISKVKLRWALACDERVDLGKWGQRVAMNMATGAPRRIESSTLQERVYRELARSIMTGHYVPGEALTIRALAANLGTSVMPVREALQRLHSDGAVVVTPNRSIRIPIMTKPAFQELIELRLLLEGTAAAAAAQSITEPEIALVEASNEVNVRAARERDLERLLQSNHDFHFGIYRAARSAHLLPIIEGLWLKMGPMYSTLNRMWDTIKGDFQKVQRDHMEVIAALRAHDRERARKATEADIHDAEAWFQDQHEFPSELEGDGAKAPD